MTSNMKSVNLVDRFLTGDGQLSISRCAPLCLVKYDADSSSTKIHQMPYFLLTTWTVSFIVLRVSYQRNRNIPRPESHRITFRTSREID